MKKIITIIAALVLCMALSLPALAQDDNGNETDVDGLIINQMITKDGHDFFEYFSQYWEQPKGVGDVEIVLGENVSPQWGNLVWVRVNDQIVFQQIINSRSMDIEELAKAVAQGVAENLVIIAFNNATAGDEDLKGTGY